MVLKELKGRDGTEGVNLIKYTGSHTLNYSQVKQENYSKYEIVSLKMSKR